MTQTSIARRFADYERLLGHWRSTRPIEWLDVSYEDVVHDLEGQARRLIDFLGLDWDPGLPGISYHAKSGANGQHASGSPADPRPLGRTMAEL